MSERPLLRVEQLLTDSRHQLAEHYRQGVQYREQVSDNEWQLSFVAGTVEGLVQVSSFLKEGDLGQALMRLQSLRVQTYCDLSECYRKYRELEKRLKDLEHWMWYGKGAKNMSAAHECAYGILECQELFENNEAQLHTKRGTIASLDECERITNEELKPESTKSLVKTSPGTVGPDFEGQAMPVRDEVKFPSYETEQLPNYPEYQPPAFRALGVGDVP